MPPSSPHPETSTTIITLGTGAIGGFYASRLSTVPHTTVSTICRSNHSAIAASGIQVLSPKFRDSRPFHPARVFRSTAEASEVTGRERRRWDYVLVTTKVVGEEWDRAVEGLVGEGTGIVVLQNGLGVEDDFWGEFGAREGVVIISAVTRTSVEQTSPGVIKHNNWTRTTIGPYFPPDPSRPEAAAYATTRTTEFADLLVKAGIEDVDTLSHMDMQFARWHKTAINAAMNPTNVLAGGPTNQAMALDEEMYKHMAGVMSEILDAAVKILGGPIPDFLPKVEQVLGGVKIDDSGGRPSMWGDWENSRKVELEAILGAPLRRARNAGIELPRTQSLYALLKKAQQMRYALR